MRAERTARELRLEVGPARTAEELAVAAVPEYSAAIPGEIDAPAFGLRLRIDVLADARAVGRGSSGSAGVATLRNWKPGDRVRLRYSGAPRKVKEVLERLRVTGTERALWPVLEVVGRIIWMRGVDLDPEPGLVVTAMTAENATAHLSEKAP